MGQSVRIPRYGGVFANLTMVITPTMGPNADNSLTLRTVSGLNHDVAPKFASVGGTQIGPVATVVAGSTPKWDGEMNFIEFGEVCAFLGPGWALCQIKIDVTWQVTGNPAFTDEIFGTFIGSGAQSAKKDDVVSCKIGAECTAIWPRGIDPFAAR